MVSRVLTGSAILTLLVVCLAFTEASLPASQARPAGEGLTDPALPVTAPLRPTPTVDQQMEALDWRARSAMICYTGRFGRVDQNAVKDLARELRQLGN